MSSVAAKKAGFQETKQKRRCSGTGGVFSLQDDRFSRFSRSDVLHNVTPRRKAGDIDVRNNKLSVVRAISWGKR